MKLFSDILFCLACFAALLFTIQHGDWLFVAVLVSIAVLGIAYSVWEYRIRGTLELLRKPKVKDAILNDLRWTTLTVHLLRLLVLAILTQPLL